MVPFRTKYFVIAKRRFAALWQSPGRVTLLIIWWFLSNCQNDTLAIIYNDGLNNDILINSGVDQVRKLVKADKMAFIIFGFDRQNGAYCVILSFIIIRTKYFVIASVAWQSPGRVTLLIIWWFLLYCQNDTLAKYMTDCDIFFGII